MAMNTQAKARFLLARQRQRQRNRQDSQVTLLAQQTGLSSGTSDVTDFISDRNQII
jgi:hypothetical protein